MKLEQTYSANGPVIVLSFYLFICFPYSHFASFIMYPIISSSPRTQFQAKSFHFCFKNMKEMDAFCRLQMKCYRSSRHHHFGRYVLKSNKTNLGLRWLLFFDWISCRLWPSEIAFSFGFETGLTNLKGEWEKDGVRQFC